jgi:hypothetical protein
MVALSFVLFFALGLALIWLWTRKSGESSSGWLNPTFKFGSLPDAVSAALKTAGMRTRIIFNGQEYSSPEEMPAEVRRAYDQAMGSVLADADRDGIPDIFEAGGGATVFHTEVRTQAVDDPAERLRKLKEMRDSGLITEQEYEAKKAEILSVM